MSNKDRDSDSERDSDSDVDDANSMKLIDRMTSELDSLLGSNMSPTPSPPANATTATSSTPPSLPVPWQNKKEPVKLYDGTVLPDDSYLVFESPYPWPTKAKADEKRCLVAVGIYRQVALCSLEFSLTLE